MKQVAKKPILLALTELEIAYVSGARRRRAAPAPYPQVPNWLEAICCLAWVALCLSIGNKAQEYYYCHGQPESQACQDVKKNSWPESKKMLYIVWQGILGAYGAI